MKKWITFFLTLHLIAEHPGDFLTEKILYELSNGDEGYNPDQLRDLQNRKVLFICDGYDELSHYKCLFKDEDNFLEKWPQAMFIVTCRDQFLSSISSWKDFFTPAKKQQPHNDLTTLSLADFSAAQRKSYVENYLIDKKQVELAYEYSEKLNALPEELLHTPFLLKLATEVLPELTNQKQRPTKSKVYELAMEKWFRESKAKVLEQSKAKDPTLELEKDLEDFSKELAYKMHRLKEFSISYSRQEEGIKKSSSSKSFFLNREKTLIHYGIPLMPIRRDESASAMVYSFMHASILEYFAAQHIADELEKDPPKSELINSRLFSEEEGFLEFMSDLVRERDIREKLFQIVFDSRKSATFARLKILQKSKENEKALEEKKIAAANAITILNYARVTFSGMDLSGINIPRANLDHAIFEHTDLRKANLRGCSLRQACLVGTDLRESDLTEARFGEALTLRGHELSVSSVAYSPRGEKLASGSWDRTVRIRSRQGDLLCTLKGHEDWVTSVAYAPEGEELASGSQDKTVRIWSCQGVLLHTFAGHEAWITSVAYAPGGEELASGSYDKTVRIWSRQGDLLHTLTGHENVVTSVAYAPGGRELASGSWDKTVRIWSDQGVLLHVLRGHEREVTSVAYAFGGEELASGSLDKIVQIWSRQGDPLHTLRGHEGSINSVAYASQELASGSDDMTVHLWKTSKETVTYQRKRFTSTVTSVAYAPGGEELALGSLDNTVRLCEANKETIIHQRKQITSTVTSIAYASQELASGSQDKKVRIWSHQGDLLHILTGHEDVITSVAYAPGEEKLASGSCDKTVRIWSKRGKLLHTLRGHYNSVTSIAYNLQELVSGSKDKTVRIWSHQGSLLHTLIGHEDWVLSVAYASGGEELASGSCDKTVRIWSKRGKLLHTLTGHEERVNSVVYAPTGEQLASGSSDKTVRIWSHQGILLHVLRGHESEVTSLAYAPQELISGSKDKTMRIWSHQGTLLHTLIGHDFEVNSVTCSSEGDYLAAVGSNGTIQLWQKTRAEKLKIPHALQWSTHRSLICSGAICEKAILSKAQKATMQDKVALVAKT